MIVNVQKGMNTFKVFVDNAYKGTYRSLGGALFLPNLQGNIYLLCLNNSSYSRFIQKYKGKTGLKRVKIKLNS